MKPLIILSMAGLIGLFGGAARGELQVVPTSDPLRVFAGKPQSFSVVWQNPGGVRNSADVRMRLMQTTTATTTTLGEWPWKKLLVLPGQTINEVATLNFPVVQAETRLLIKWLADSNRLFGVTEILVYPTNLLAELKALAGAGQAVGLFDPGDVLKPLLKSAGVEFEDFEALGFTTFHGTLAIIGPFASCRQMAGDLTERIEKLAHNGAGVVWIYPSPGPHDKLQPSIQTVLVGTGAVVIGQAELVADLANRPQAQLNLIHFCRLARDPQPPRLPKLNPPT